MPGSARLGPGRHPARRAAAALLALACALGALVLAAHHPLAPALALPVTLAAAAFTFWRPTWGLAGLLALLPWAGLMPWTGWLVVEEFDLLLPAVVAGGHARIAAGWPARPQSRMRLARVWLLWLPLLLATALAVAIGVADAGGLVWGWWQGYHEPLNSLRLAKPLLAASLLLPVWRALWREDAARAAQAFQWGMAGMLGTAALGVLWERLAFTGLLDFSSDYRATGLFWEMHIGGAALDAVLAASLPFAVMAWRGASTPRRWALAAALVALGLYAALVTFSRIVYLALPLGLACSFLLQARQARQQGLPAAPGWAGALAGAALYAALAWWLFPGSGWRGQLTLLGAVALLLPLVHLHSRSRTPWVPVAMLFGLLAVGVVAAGLAALLPKGAYGAYALAWLATAAALWRGRGGGLGAVVLSWAGFAGVLVALPAVGLQWGEIEGLERSLPVAVLLALLAGFARRGPPWPPSWRRQGRLLGLCALLSGVVGVFGGGAYMGDRVTATREDGDVRRAHWTQALSMLRSSTDQLFGMGLGRYPAQHAMSVLIADQSGGVRLQGEEGSFRVAMTGGKNSSGWVEVFRLSQRTRPARGDVQVRLRLRADQDVGLHLELCEKHLLYNAGCRTKGVSVRAAPGQWQAVQAVLAGAALDGGAWYAPRLVVFSIGVGTPGVRVEIDDLSLVDGAGEMLVNGDFGRGLARWFTSSDRHHLPWHAKNLGVHVLVEQGLLGAAAMLLLLLPALWRVTLGAARQQALAPPLAGAVVGLLTVGLVDSLLDMPRVAFVAWWLLLMALALPGQRPAGPVRRGAP